MSPSTARRIGLLAVSAGIHMAAVGGLGFLPPPTASLAVQPTYAEFEVLASEPEPELVPGSEGPPTPRPETEPEPEPKPRKSRPRRLTRLRKPKPVPEPKEEPPSASEAPVDFTGVTLTAKGRSSWTTAVGSGSPIREPVGRIGQVTGRDRQGISGGIIGGTGKPRVLRPGDLSRRPRAPSNLDRLLEKHYPGRARTQGIEGRAVVRVRILPSGKLGTLSLKRETGRYGFGAACIATLRAGGRWKPALDHQGRPGIYEVDFPCTFEVAF